MYGEKQTHEAGWTEERVNLLKVMWSDGKSAGEIRNALGGGVTRSGVIGKVHRLKLDKRGQTGNKVVSVKPKANGKGQPTANAIVHNVRAMRSLPPRPLPDDEIDVGVDASHLLGIMSLDNTTCRWPMGSATGSAQLFCGVHKSRHAGPYCPEHTRKSEYQR